MLKHQARAEVLSHLLATARAQLGILADVKACDAPLLANRHNVNVMPNRQDAAWPQTGSWNILLTARTAAGL
jgi:hypothetical protein